MHKKIKNFLEAPHKETPIIVIAGPTATGKSKTALELAKQYNGYIINADSRQIYKELKIGTAQPQPDSITEESTVPGKIWKIDGIDHLLYGYVSIFDKFSLYKYKKDVEQILKSSSSDKIPFLVGGTGLYIDSVVLNYDLQKEEIDKGRRKELSKKTVQELQEIAGKAVKKLNRSDRNNPHRLIRLIERGGELYRRSKPKDHLFLVINPERESLGKSIVGRVDKMFEKGLIDENKRLRELLVKKGYTDLNSYPKALDSIGYQEFNGYFEGDKDLVIVKEEIVTHTLQYAKRQKTWFSKHKNKCCFAKV